MDLTNYVPTPISAMKDRFAEARYDPTMLTKAALETVDTITNGKAQLVDATNPFVMGIEMAAAQTANATMESLVNLRKQYPALATSIDDLYMHMSDSDYLDRFAVPTTGKMTFALQLSAIIANAPFDATENAKKLIIPRDTQITVDGVVFTTLYPIVIRYYDNGVLQVSYDPAITTPLYTLRNTIIDAGRRQTSLGDPWIFFEVETLQVLAVSEHTVQDGSFAFEQRYSFVDSYCYARVFYSNTATNNTWVELRTTHTDQVFDPRVPTAVLRVGDQELTVSIPTIYTQTGQISGTIRVDIYSTKGQLSMNLRNYRQDAYKVTPTAFDEVRDLNVYTQALANVSYYVYSTDMVSGGTAALTFDQLRDRVIYNALGPQALPITNVQLLTDGQNNGFDLVKNVDVLTNRIILATRKLPTPTLAKLITPANVGIVTYTTDGSDLINHPKVISNGDRVTIRSKAIWLNVNGQIRLVSQADLNALLAMTQTAMVNAINAAQYFYTPFYYVMDSSADEFDLRAYALDQPYGKNQNFVTQNETLNLFVNTDTYQLTKVDSGYQLRIVTRSGDNYKALQDSQVGVQLAFHPKGDSAYAYIPGILESKTQAGERIYRFDIATSHDFDSKDLIAITSGQVQGIPNYVSWIDLETPVELLHWTSSITDSYKPDASDVLLGKFLLPPMAAGNTHEELTLHLGDALSNLWRRAHSTMTDTVYKRYTEDIPLTYPADVMDVDPVTGSAVSIVDGQVVYHYLHRKGDPVLDVSGNPIYKYKVGDVVKDAAGNPEIDTLRSIRRELDILVVDARYYFATDPATQDYRNEVDATLTDWIVDTVEGMQQDLLDETSLFFYPKTTLGTIPVLIDNNGQDNLSAEQAFTLDLYVSYAVYNNPDIKDKLRTITVQILDEAISQTTINLSKVGDSLRTAYGESVQAFKLSGLGGARDYQVVTVASGRNKLCLKKQLVIQPDKSMVVSDDVTLNWKVVS